MIYSAVEEVPIKCLHIISVSVSYFTAQIFKSADFRGVVFPWYTYCVLICLQFGET
jgi:hypothetical protein